MDNPIVAENQARNPFADDEFSGDLSDPKPNLPMCPNACGPLAFYNAATQNYPYVRCQRCEWKQSLAPDQARDLTEAIMGLNPGLDLDLFLVEVVRAADADAKLDWSECDRLANYHRSRWSALVEMAMAEWDEFQAADQAQDRILAKRDGYRATLEKLTGVKQVA